MTDNSRDKQPKKEQPKKEQPKKEQPKKEQPKKEQPKRQQPENQGNGKGLDDEAQKHIGRMLKATYEEIAHEPVPDKFLELLKQLEASEPRK